MRPGTDAWCLAAIGAVIVQEGLTERRAGWPSTRPGVDEVRAHLGAVDVARYCEIAGVAEDDVRAVARRIAGASSVAVFEDLGVQMSLHSTLSSYLEKLVWLLTGSFGIPGGQYVPTSIVNLAGAGQRGRGSSRVSPVAGARIISGLVPCNVIAEEILTDHPDRYRAMLVESGNPAHSLADSQRMREALGSLDLLVVIDVAMTETARLADYVLPASSQYEKWEATFFNFEFPDNVFHLRRPLLDPLPGTLAEPEIHARLCEALGVLTDDDYAPLRAAAEQGRAAFADAFFAAAAERPSSAGSRRSCSTAPSARPCPTARRAAAVLWGACHRCAQTYPESVRRAGFDGEGLEAGEQLFDAVLSSPSGLVFTVDEPEVSWSRLHDRRRPGAPRGARAARRARRPRVRGPAGQRPGVPVRPVRRRTPLVHRQHDLPRPVVAEARSRRLAAGQPGRRRRPAVSSTATSCGWSPAAARWSRRSRCPR